MSGFVDVVCKQIKKSYLCLKSFTLDLFRSAFAAYKHLSCSSIVDLYLSIYRPALLFHHPKWEEMKSLASWCYRTSAHCPWSCRSRCGTCGRCVWSWCCRCGGRRCPEWMWRHTSRRRSEGSSSRPEAHREQTSAMKTCSGYIRDVTIHSTHHSKLN